MVNSIPLEPEARLDESMAFVEAVIVVVLIIAQHLHGVALNLVGESDRVFEQCVADVGIS